MKKLNPEINEDLARLCVMRSDIKIIRAILLSVSMISFSIAALIYLGKIIVPEFWCEIYLAISLPFFLIDQLVFKKTYLRYQELIFSINAYCGDS
jgi:hypothetical protein